MIAACVAGLNAGAFRNGAHRVAAEGFGVDEALFDGLMADPEASAVDPKLKPILAYDAPARPHGRGGADAVYAAGWDEQALFDGISVCALFNFMKRIVEGSGIRRSPLAETPEEKTARRARMAPPGGDPHSAPHACIRLVESWGPPR